MKDLKDDFLNEVTSQIKSKEARKFVADELRYHIRQTKNAWTEKGLNDSEAEEKAIAGMGNPTLLGIQMNKLHRPKVDWWLIALLGVSLLLGFLPLWALSQNNYVASPILWQNKLIIVVLGAIVAIAVMFMDYRKWKSKGWLFYGLGVGLLLTIRLFANRMINGVPRIEIGPLTIESLMAIPFLFLAWACFFNDIKFKVWQFIGLFLLPVYLFLEFPSMASVYIYVMMVLVMLGWSRFSKKTIISLLVTAFGSVMVVSLLSWRFIKDYQKERLLAFIQPEKHSEGAGFIIFKIKEFLTSAGWFGNVGKAEFLPEAHTDYVFVTFTYYYGWLLAAVLILVLALFAVRVIFVAFNIKDSFAKLLLIGVVALYVAQLATNLAMMLGVFPIISVSMPFMSYGLMPTVLNAILIGIVLSVYRRSGTEGQVPCPKVK